MHTIIHKAKWEIASWASLLKILTEDKRLSYTNKERIPGYSSNCPDTTVAVGGFPSAGLPKG